MDWHGRAGGEARFSITLNHEEGEKDVYILKGAPEGEVYEPRFALHPVRHVLVTGLEGEPTLETLTGVEVYSDVDLFGSFTCSNELFNQIHSNIQRSLKVGLKGFILDCLHREPIAYNEPASIFGSLSARKCMPDLWMGFAHSIQLAGSENGDLSDIVPRLPGILPLAIGIVPPENRQQLIDNIAKTITEADGGKFRVGHAGLPGYMESLVENGLGEIGNFLDNAWGGTQPFSHGFG